MIKFKVECVGAPMWIGIASHGFSRDQIQMAGNNLSTAPGHLDGELNCLWTWQNDLL